MSHIITSNIFGSLAADDITTVDQTSDAGTAESGDFAKAKAGKAKRNAGRAKAIKGLSAPDGLGVSKPKKADTAPKALFAAKAGVKAKADKPAKPVKVKADKPAKAPAKAKEPKAPTTKETPAPVASPVDALVAKWESKAEGTSIRSLLQEAFDAGRTAPRARQPRAGGPTKRDIAADLLKRKQGATAKDILEATGWPTVSVPAIARAANLTLTQTKEGRTTTYFGTPA